MHRIAIFLMFIKRISLLAHLLWTLLCNPLGNHVLICSAFISAGHSGGSCGVSLLEQSHEPSCLDVHGVGSSKMSCWQSSTKDIVIT